MKSFRNFVVLIAIVAGVLAANAQVSLQGKFQLPSETRWGKTVLPAGEYSVRIDSMQAPVRMIVQAENGKSAIIAVAERTANAEPGGSYLFITGSGADRQVRSINLPQLGVSLVYNPLTGLERETMYAAASHTIPLLVAKR